MKKIHLIEWGITAVGLIFGYRAIEALFSAFVTILYSPIESDSEFLWVLVFPVIYMITFIVLVKNAEKIAFTFFPPGSEESPTLPIKLGKKLLLQIILIAISFSILIHGLAEVVVYLVQSFKNAVGTRHDFSAEGLNELSKYHFHLALARSVLAFLVLYFSKSIAEWFFRKNEKDELILETPELQENNTKNNV